MSFLLLYWYRRCRWCLEAIPKDKSFKKAAAKRILVILTRGMYMRTMSGYIAKLEGYTK